MIGTSAHLILFIDTFLWLFVVYPYYCKIIFIFAFQLLQIPSSLSQPHIKITNAQDPMFPTDLVVFVKKKKKKVETAICWVNAVSAKAQLWGSKAIAETNFQDI